jgi:hypothetical protein
MNTSFWGKDWWKLTHSIAYSYDNKNEKCYKTFFESRPTDYQSAFNQDNKRTTNLETFEDDF